MPSPSERLRRKLTTDNVWIYVLSLLSRRDMYGYELREEIRSAFGFKPGNVTAYRVLYSLRRAGMVGSLEKSVNGRKRRYYTISKKGERELEAGREILKGILSKL